jgi:hypothetical protein
MEDHPVLGAVLFAIGIAIIAIAYSGLNPLPLLILGHIVALNGAFWVILDWRKQQVPYGERSHGDERYPPKI